MFKTRTRMVSFRLSDDEYERLKDLSLSERARSVSEFARAALCRLPEGNGDHATMGAPRMEMHQLRQFVETTLVPAPGPTETATRRISNDKQGESHAEAVCNTSAF